MAAAAFRVRLSHVLLRRNIFSLRRAQSGGRGCGRGEFHRGGGHFGGGGRGCWGYDDDGGNCVLRRRVVQKPSGPCSQLAVNIGGRKKRRVECHPQAVDRWRHEADRVDPARSPAVRQLLRSTSGDFRIAAQSIGKKPVPMRADQTVAL